MASGNVKVTISLEAKAYKTMLNSVVALAKLVPADKMQEAKAIMDQICIDLKTLTKVTQDE